MLGARRCITSCRHSFQRRRYADAPPLRAASKGRVLVLEGVEKAERNVLPILNNLLENREMHLEDGRFLVSPQRYDALARQQRASGRAGERLASLKERFPGMPPDVLQRAPLRQVSVAVRRIDDGQSALSAFSDAESSSGSVSNIHS